MINKKKLTILFVILFCEITVAATAAQVCAKPATGSCSGKYERGVGSAIIYNCSGEIKEFEVVSKCSSTAGTAYRPGTPEIDTTDPDNNKYCWCRLNSVDGIRLDVTYGMINGTSSGWIYIAQKNSAGLCIFECALLCGTRTSIQGSDARYYIFHAAGID